MNLKSIRNLSKNRCEKSGEKNAANSGSGGMRAGPKGYHFKRFPSEKNKEESRLKGENKVECKKWNAKGTYRKASAEREPTQDLNTLGGQRPRADSGRKRAFRRARVFLFVGLWVCGFVGLWVCGFVGLWGCGVVVCVCVCFIGRVGPKKLQKSASFANFYQNLTKMGSKSTTNETNLGQGGGGGRGNRKLTKI